MNGWAQDPDALTAVLRRVAGARAGARLAAADEAALEAVFACSRRLAVYGTLAPGECNHGLLAGIAGVWSTGAVHGRREVRHHAVFTWDPQASPVPVHLFTADDLPRHWARLDAFEGPGYCRILVPVTHAGMLIAVANLYAGAAPGA